MMTFCWGDSRCRLAPQLGYHPLAQTNPRLSKEQQEPRQQGQHNPQGEQVEEKSECAEDGIARQQETNAARKVSTRNSGQEAASRATSRSTPCVCVVIAG